MKRNIISIRFSTAAILLLCINPLVSAVSAENPNSALLDAAGFDKLERIDPNLTTAGINYGIIARSLTYSDGIPQNDYKPDINLDYLENAQISWFDYASPAPSNSPHSTDICSILLGEGRQSNFTGLTPQASADIYEFWYFLGEHIFPQNPPDSEIITASFGSPVSDWWTRGFQSMAEKHNKVIIAAIGNGKSNSRLPLYPAAGGNAIGVGLVCSTSRDSNSPDRFNLALPEYSTAGPTSANTCKPDIVAPSNFMIPAANDSNSFRSAGDFSSFSVPTVSAAAGLLLNKSRTEPSLQDAFSSPAGNFLMKSILLNSARKLPYWHKGRLTPDDDHTVPLDYLQGAGMLDAHSAYRHLTAGQNEPGNTANIGWDKNSIERDNPSAEKIYRLNIEDPNQKYLTATLCWNFHYQTDFPFNRIPEKDTDLLVEIWAGNANEPNDYHLIDYSDSPNGNTEHIFCKLDPNYTQYDIVVTRNPYSVSDIPPGEQHFAVSWNVSNPDMEQNEGWYDLNYDGEINETDISILMDNLIKSKNSPQTPDYLFGDINGNSKIDIEDLRQFTRKVLP